MEKIAFLIPATSNKRPWKTVQETDLWNILLRSLQKNNLNYDISIYVGYDKGDKIYGKTRHRVLFAKEFLGFKFTWVEFDETYKGKVTHIWNELGKRAVADGFEYLNIMGSDIRVPKETNWLSVFLMELYKNKNRGWVAGISPSDTKAGANTSIPTQFFIHRKHIDAFGFIFPWELTNWYCDNWLYSIYPEKLRVWLKRYVLYNSGGTERYTRKSSDKKVWPRLIKKYRPLLKRLK